MTFGFIITSHINSENTNRYWIECYKCIRKIYQDNYILIIQDNIDSSYFKVPEDLILKNVFFITSEFPKSGELLPYYYFYRVGVHFFNKAVIIHDSTFIQKDFLSNIIDDITTFRILWTFSHDTNAPVHDHALLRCIKNSEELISFYEEKNKWIGCFGVQCIITFDFVCKLQDKYNFFNLLHRVKDRNSRCSAERCFSVLCHKEDCKREALFGEMSYEYAFSSFDTYVDKIKTIEDKKPLYKVLSGR
jgi:hypothetical protein